MNLKLIFLIILGVVSIVYLITLKFKPGVFQFILKGLLMPVILCIYIFGIGTADIFWPVVLALVFAWIGDILLLKITNILWFKLGLASFLIGHIFYCIAMYGFIRPFNILAFVISVIIAASFGVFIFKYIKPSKQMKIPVIAYEAIIMVMVIFALQLFLSQMSLFGALVFAGSLCFVTSDTLLALKTFRRKKFYFAVMITYIAAQLLITLGFCLA